MDFFDNFVFRNKNDPNMKVINLGESNSALNNYVAQLRDRVIQKDRLRFRTNLERIGYIFGYEISKTLNSS